MRKTALISGRLLSLVLAGSGAAESPTPGPRPWRGHKLPSGMHAVAEMRRLNSTDMLWVRCYGEGVGLLFPSGQSAWFSRA